MIQKAKSDFFIGVAELLRYSKQSVVRQVNSAMVITYFEIGRMIVEEEQNGKDRAAYGTQLLEGLSEYLTNEFGRGFSADNLENMRRFYSTYQISETPSRKSIKTQKKVILQTPSEESENGQKAIQETPSAELQGVQESIGQTVSDQLTKIGISETPSRIFNLGWSHYLILMRIDNLQERSFYEIESTENNWSVRELKRQVDSALFQRLSLSRDKEGVKKLASEGQLLSSAKDTLKDPYILEFLNLSELRQYSEKEFEQGLIDKLEHFLLELGKGFTFVARQKRISFDERHFYIDLVFYNRILKCFVLIDLKIGDLKHQDIGQIQMYVNYYDRKMRIDDENKTIGIILCQDKSDTLVEITLPEDNEQIYASRYMTVLPSKEEFKELFKND